MRSNKIFRILAIGTILALLVVALPVSPVLAAEDINLDPDEGEIGDYFYVEGDGFDESWYDSPTVFYDSYVDIYFSNEEADEGDEIDDEVENYHSFGSDRVDEDGEFSKKVEVPEELEDGDKDEDVRGGTYYVYVTYENDDEIVAVAAFTVMAAEIILDTDEGTVGTEVEINGVDFAEDEYIEVFYDGDEIDIESGDDETDGNGEFTLIIVIPESTAGDHTIKVTDESDSEAEADFTVEPEITVNPTKGAPGDSATVKGTGFGNRVDVDIEFDGSNVTTDEADTYGSFEIVITVPVKSSGIYKIEAEDEDRNKADVNFTLAAAATLGQTTGNVGSQVTINGTGFTPNGNITVTYAAKTVATTTADANGKFSATFTVPRSTAGQQTVTASDGTNTVSDTFTMESTPPPAPQLVLPLDATKAKSEATFEWNGVSDPSLPVTYSLQVATDAGFTSIVVRKPGLTETTYTLTKEEKLESTKKEAPYYWRVQAVDGADNESGWTSPSSFYVGFTFALTGWILYVLIGLAGLILLLVGILVGRRLAYF